MRRNSWGFSVHWLGHSIRIVYGELIRDAGTSRCHLWVPRGSKVVPMSHFLSQGEADREFPTITNCFLWLQFGSVREF